MIPGTFTLLLPLSGVTILLLLHTILDLPCSLVAETVLYHLTKLIQSIRKEAISGRNDELPSLRHALSLYDQINLIDKVPEDQLRFQGYTETGFTVNGIEREGSLLCIGNLLLSWASTTFSQVTPQSLSIFQIVRPIPGKTYVENHRYKMRAMKYYWTLPLRGSRSQVAGIPPLPPGPPPHSQTPQ